MTHRVIFVDPEYWTNPPPREDNIVTNPPPREDNIVTDPPVPVANDVVRMIEAGEQ